MKGFSEIGGLEKIFRELVTGAQYAGSLIPVVAGDQSKAVADCSSLRRGV